MELPEKYKQLYYSLKKGYEGEDQFDLSMSKLLQGECIVVNDLLLKSNNTTFQLDCVLITNDTIYLLDIKNYEGDYCYENDKFFRLNKYESVEIHNPVVQLKRSETLLRQLLHLHDLIFPVSAYIIFINPEFTLYQAPQDLPIVFPTQLKRFFNKINKVTTNEKLQSKHKHLAEKLILIGQDSHQYLQKPDYHFGNLRKGIVCEKCFSFSCSTNGNNVICHDCGHAELISSAVLRSVEEFSTLFPGHPITTNVLFDWCEIVSCKKRIRRILLKKYNQAGNGRWTYYL